MVIQCPSSIMGRAACVMRRELVLVKPTLPTRLGQLTRYLVGSIRVTCRSKIAKIMPIQDGRHLENLFFASSPETKDQLTPNLLGSIRATCRSNKVKIMSIGNPRWPYGSHLENLCFASTP